mmetsp:Transcript_22063/g.63642  ORF Transcript_22063/g.63642 Transcript_22063/m.63642 type:complete len:208 (+) Transcript_22063:5229-5852(+)
MLADEAQDAEDGNVGLARTGGRAYKHVLRPAKRSVEDYRLDGVEPLGALEGNLSPVWQLPDVYELHVRLRRVKSLRCGHVNPLVALEHLALGAFGQHKLETHSGEVRLVDVGRVARAGRGLRLRRGLPDLEALHVVRVRAYARKKLERGRGGGLGAGPALLALLPLAQLRVALLALRVHYDGGPDGHGALPALGLLGRTAALSRTAL